MRKLRSLLIAIFPVFLLAVAGCGKPTGSSTATAPQAPQAPVAPQMEQVAAGVGVGEKGRRLDQDHVVDAIAQPAKSLFAVEERLTFNVQIVQALNFFKSSEGRAPKDHDEFMQKIIQPNNIQLPELPAGQRYVWDPATEKLMVERPVEAENRQLP
jgi:hypothetical protein